MRLTQLAFVVLIACAPTVPTPAEHQRSLDAGDAVTLAHELAALPAARDAHVTLGRAVVDPFSGARSRAYAGAIVVVDERADVAAIERSATALLHAAVPEAEPAVAVQRVGARAVERAGHDGALAALLAFVATLAGCFAWRERWRVLGR